MPSISSFFGITIYMFFDEHNPPHFHAYYAEYKAVIKIEDLSLLNGALPPRALGLVIEWASLHQKALMENWTRMLNENEYSKIEPLK